MCISNNSEFIEHNQITTKDLWKDGIHLTECGKVFLARNLLDAINIINKSSLSQVSSTHVEGTSQGSALKKLFTFIG